MELPKRTGSVYGKNPFLQKKIKKISIFFVKKINKTP